MNCLILGWVTKAMTSIVATTLEMSEHRALAICIFFLIPFTGFYVALGGLWGVLWTDLFQFVLKMSIVIAIAYYAVHAVGGMPALIARLGQMRMDAMRMEPKAATGDPLAFFPNLSSGLTTEM